MSSARFRVWLRQRLRRLADRTPVSGKIGHKSRGIRVGYMVMCNAVVQGLTRVHWKEPLLLLGYFISADYSE